MTREDVIRLAREAGFGIGLSDLYAPALERFAALIVAEQERILFAAYQVAMYQVAAEREACAKAAEEWLPDSFDEITQEAIAAKIRARGKQE